MRSPSKVNPYAWVILAVVYLASVMAPLNQFKVPPIMPVLIETFSIDLTQAGLLMSIIALVGLLLALPAGMVLQRLGAKATGLIALGCLAAGAVTGALAGSFPVLLLSRVIEGMGVGLVSVVAPAAIAQWFPPDRQGAPMGIWATWVPVGTVVMYNAAPALATGSGWRAVWWLAAGLTAAAMLIFGLFIRRPPQLMPAGAQPAAQPPLAQTLANRNIWLLSAAFMCFNLALVSFATYFPTFLNTVRGYDLGTAGFIASISNMVTLVSAPLAGLLSDRLGTRRKMIALPFLVVGVMILLPFQVAGAWIVVSLVLMAVVAGAIPTATFAAAPEVMPRPELAGLGLAVILIGQNLGQLLGPVLFGQMAEQWGWVTASLFLLPVCLAGFISAWLVRVR